MRISWFVSLGLLSLLLGGAGCSASVSATVDTCSSDSSVTCSGTDTGLSCTGSATPDATDGDCVAATAAGTYCCAAGGTIVVVPDLPTTCAQDPTVSTCATGTAGYSCTGSDAPDESDPTLSCSIGVPDTGTAGSTDYCCLTGETFAAGTCGQDDTITSICTTAGSFGFKCAASDTPDQTDSTLTCSSGVADADGTSTDFCCTDGSGGGTGVTIVITTGCTVDTTVTGCADPSTGYSCTGSDPPDQADPTLSCSIGVADGSDATLTDYCCLTGEDFAAGTCAQDDTITSICTTAGSFGFRCASSDTPDQTDSTLTCSTGVADADGTSTDFCCTN
jgi:hypothetical protein